MEITIKINTSTKECEILSMRILSSKMMVLEICSYLTILYEDLIDTPLNREDTYTYARKIICYILTNKGVKDTTIMRLLNYTGATNVTDMYNSAYTLIHIDKDPEIIRTVRNITKILEDYDKSLNV